MFCQNKKGALGLEEADGSFADYVIADSRFTVPIPDNVSFADTVSPFLYHAKIGSFNVCRCHYLFLY
jgi:D-arabinose 1-dehydrogenase-like Zn-dependent alcohol dehydrogenase